MLKMKQNPRTWGPNANVIFQTTFSKIFGFHHSHKEGIIVILIFVMANGTSLSISKGDRKPAFHLNSIVSRVCACNMIAER